MQKKVEFIAQSQEDAISEAVKKLHISSDKIFINVLGELPEGLNCEALVDVNLTIEINFDIDAVKYIQDFELNL